MPALGAPEVVPQDSPDSCGSAGRTDTGAPSSNAVEGTPGEAPEPGEDIDEATNDDVNSPRRKARTHADPKVRSAQHCQTTKCQEQRRKFHR